jgi:serine phosphatase RsbU (regulator of sigma subunit)
MVSGDWLKAEYIMLLSSYVDWENEELIDTFEIAVLESETIYTHLDFKSESQEFKDKPFRVRYYSRINKIKAAQILYIGREKNASLRKIWSRWKNQPMLMVTDSSSMIEYSMINLLNMNSRGKPFEINKSNIDASGLTISSKILAVGGSEDDLRMIYRESERDLEGLKSDIAGLNDELLLRQGELEKSLERLRQRTSEIKTLNEEIALQTGQLDGLSKDIDSKRDDLADKLLLLRRQENSIQLREEEVNTLNEEIKIKEKEIQDRSEIMALQQKNIREQQLLMNEQNAILDEQSVLIVWQKNALVFFILLSVLVLVMVLFIYRAYRIKKRASRIWREKNRIIQKQNETITAGIYYALTIQQSILPEEAEINRHFESFIIYYPKDIVSGDFYWFSHRGKKKSGQETSFIAVVDCTGHGVPGGFLSMIGARILSAIINENKVYETDRIVEIMDQRIKEALNQQKSENDDGMDITLCKIIKDPQGKEGRPEFYVSFTGARQSLFIVRNQQEVEVIKADRRTIGGKYFNPEPFSKNNLVLKEGDCLYLTTDGLIDQNSPSRDKFGSRRFIRILNEHRDKSMSSQKQKIEEEMIGFMKAEKQRDDITIIGIKL